MALESRVKPQGEEVSEYNLRIVKGGVGRRLVQDAREIAEVADPRRHHHRDSDERSGGRPLWPALVGYTFFSGEKKARCVRVPGLSCFYLFFL